eukprot:CAMPEP_0173464498 /NCGR_PEP_ID=MMETSP1357-20121228/70075_1 /TAXON_ID=77926 /ORGANISM="Hemiselmis rufescens, Strain PCC563" /LENGTH=80 /DNA_ID=CAMNT_0014432417 /DNA_START=47 /DNA_END=285 /DNA_ORIENTATION=-
MSVLPYTQAQQISAQISEGHAGSAQATSSVPRKSRNPPWSQQEMVVKDYSPQYAPTEALGGQPVAVLLTLHNAGGVSMVG